VTTHDNVPNEAETAGERPQHRAARPPVAYTDQPEATQPVDVPSFVPRHATGLEPPNASRAEALSSKYAVHTNSRRRAWPPSAVTCTDNASRLVRGRYQEVRDRYAAAYRVRISRIRT